MSSGKDPIQIQAERMAETMRTPNVPNAVLLILYDLRIPVNSAGFRFLKDLLPAALETPSYIVETELFAVVGGRYIPRVAIKSMDKAVHTVLRKAWRSREIEVWRKYIPEYIMERGQEPTNMEFISCIVYFLEFWQNCYEEAGHEK